MRALIISIPTILVAAGVLGIAACSTKFADTDESPESTSSAMRTVTEVPGSPMCPQRTTLLCQINFAFVDAGPTRACTPFIQYTPLGGGTELLWWSRFGQLVSAVIVGGGHVEGDPTVDRSNVYEYDRPIAPPSPGPGELVLVPRIDGGDERLKLVTFCAPSDAGEADATVDAPHDASADAPADAGRDGDAGGSKTW